MQTEENGEKRDEVYVWVENGIKCQSIVCDKERKSRQSEQEQTRGEDERKRKNQTRKKMKEWNNKNTMKNGKKGKQKSEKKQRIKAEKEETNRERYGGKAPNSMSVWASGDQKCDTLVRLISTNTALEGSASETDKCLLTILTPWTPARQATVRTR